MNWELRTNSGVDELKLIDERGSTLSLSLETHVDRSGMRKLDVYGMFCLSFSSISTFSLCSSLLVDQ